MNHKPIVNPFFKLRSFRKAFKEDVACCGIAIALFVIPNLLIFLDTIIVGDSLASSYWIALLLEGIALLAYLNGIKPIMWLVIPRNLYFVFISLRTMFVLVLAILFSSNANIPEYYIWFLVAKIVIELQLVIVFIAFTIIQIRKYVKSKKLQRDELLSI